MKDKKEVQFEQPSEILIIFNRYIMLVLALLILGILISGYWFLLKPKIADINSFEAQVSQTQERKMLNEALVLKVKELADEYNSIKTNRQSDLESLTKMIPADPKIAELFVASDMLAQGRGFKLVAIEISDKGDNISGQTAIPTVNNFNDKSAVATSTPVVTPMPIKSMVIHMSIMKLGEDEQYSPESSSVNNAYDDFKGYLSDLENNIRLADIQAINFGELSGLGANSTFSFDLLTYYK